MATNEAFLFVNTSGLQSLDRKASTTARAFIMRKVRAERSQTNRQGHSAATRQCKGTADDNEYGHEALEMVLQGDMAIYRPKATNKPATYSGNKASVHQQLMAHPPIPQSKLDGSVDPFGTTGAGLEKNEAILLDFCTLIHKPSTIRHRNPSRGAYNVTYRR